MASVPLETKRTRSTDVRATISSASAGAIGAWSDEELEATSRDSLMEENVDIAPEDAASSAPPAPEAIEVDPSDTPEDTSGAESETGSARPAGRERPSRPG